MRLTTRFATLLAAGALGVTPALALAHGDPHPGKPPFGKGQTTMTTTTGMTTSPYTMPGARYGVLCRGESKHHVKGMRGTPFSACVVALAHAAKQAKTSPAKACAGESKRHVKGQKGTPYSQCVTAVAHLRQHAH
jgi:hypothetical protein